jgi:hypothetical protein
MNQVTQFRQEGRPIIKADIRAWTITLKRTLPLTFIILVWSLSGVSLWAFYGALLLLGGIPLIRQVWCFRSAEGRRQASVAPGSGYRPFATLQPVPNAAALPVPSTITQQPGWLAWVVCPPVVWCVVVFFPFVVAPEQVLHLTLSFLAISLLLTVSISIWLLLPQYQRIEITAWGLAVKTAFGCHTIRWKEAQLFAIDGTLSFTNPPSRYELSSATTIVRWERQTSPALWPHLGQPFADYDQKMKALHAFIAAQTGLSLLDVRLPRVRVGAVTSLPPEPS